MPAHFMPTPPGVVGDTQRVARRGHPVVLSGEVLGIINMVYELAALAVDAPPPNRDAKLVPYGFLAWLTCPALVAVREHIIVQLSPDAVNVVVLRHALAAQQGR